jgi:N-acetylglucosamine malate deacetylase 2
METKRHPREIGRAAAPLESARRVLLLVAHPDDESIACAGLLQRAASALVVFAVDGAPRGYGFETKFASLQNYSNLRFAEAARALGHVASCSHQRLQRRDGTYFRDPYLYKGLREAAASLLPIVQSFAPDVIVSHAYEGGHFDHDACSFLAAHAAAQLSLAHYEFPIYWSGGKGAMAFQQFRERGEREIVFMLATDEITVKKEMLAEYRTQNGIASAFSPDLERFRLAPTYDYAHPTWTDYPPRTWRTRRDAAQMRRAFAKFPLPAPPVSIRDK